MKDYPNGKLCGNCGYILPVVAFGTRYKTHRNGERYLFIRSWCDDCRRYYSRETYWRNKTPNAERVCPWCRVSFIPSRSDKIYCSSKCCNASSAKKCYTPVSAERSCKRCGALFYGMNRYICDDCRKKKSNANSAEHSRLRKQRDPEFRARELARLRKWKEENPDKEKARMKQKDRRRESLKCGLPATLTEGEWQLALEYFEWCCAYCGEDGELHREHFIPMAKGGGYTADNIVPACPDCNLDKLDTLPLEWLIMQDIGLFKYVQISQYLERM